MKNALIISVYFWGVMWVCQASTYREYPPWEEDEYDDKPERKMAEPESKCPDEFMVVGEKCVMVKLRKMSWYAAQRECAKTTDSRLLEIHTGNCYVDIIKFLKDNDHDTQNVSYWIGADMSSGQWAWSSNNQIKIPEPFWATTFVDGRYAKEPLDKSKRCGFLDASRKYFMNAGRCQAGMLNAYICQTSPKAEEIKTIKTTPAPSNECESGWSYHDKHCFKLMAKSVTHSEAETYCEDQRATLASLNSQTENNFVQSIVSVRTDLPVWIGLSQTLKSQWTDKSSYNFDNFWETDVVELCITLLPQQEGKWQKKFCQDRYRFVCEKEALPKPPQPPKGESDSYFNWFY